MPPDNTHLIAFDLEGPLSPNDNAYELMQLFPGGDQLFQVISRYDDLLTEEGRLGYEPGDTLALIVPFLIYHGISPEDILRLAEEARFISGAKELITRLKSEGWKVHCITTTYLPYARRLVQKLGMDTGMACGTVLSLDYYREVIPQKILERIASVEKDISQLKPGQDDIQIKERLDNLFWKSERELAWLLQETKPMGGRRKLLALRTLALSYRLPLKDIVAVGDSITDSRMLEGVNKAGGLAIAFNANKYALQYATMSLASTNIFDLWPILDTWAKGGREAVREVMLAKKKKPKDRDNFHWLEGKTLPLQVHARIRRLVREKAAELG